MRKLLTVFVMLASMVFASCGNSTKSETVEDSIYVDTLESVSMIDTITVDSVVTPLVP